MHINNSEGYHVQKITHSCDVAAIRIHMPTYLVHQQIISCNATLLMICPSTGQQLLASGILSARLPAKMYDNVSGAN
jgi:hypothetical protein